MDKSLFHIIYKFCNDNWEKLLKNSDGHLKTPCPMTVQVSKLQDVLKKKLVKC